MSFRENDPNLVFSIFFSEIRKRSYAETAQFQENFEVYIQALISQCLDSNFLDEVFSDQGTYLFEKKKLGMIFQNINFFYFSQMNILYLILRKWTL